MLGAADAATVAEEIRLTEVAEGELEALTLRAPDLQTQVVAPGSAHHAHVAAPADLAGTAVPVPSSA